MDYQFDLVGKIGSMALILLLAKFLESFDNISLEFY